MLQERSNTTLAQALSQPRLELIPIGDVLEQARYIPPGATVTVTSSPGRGLEPTLRTAEDLARLGYRVVPHIAARLIEDGVHLDTVVERLQRSDIRDIYVIGGDSDAPAGPFDSAAQLLAALEDRGAWFDSIGIAGYPEGHPLIDDERLWRALESKALQATYIVTQMCFDGRSIVNWIDAARTRGIDLPIYVGIPGVCTRMHLLRVAGKIGVGESSSFLWKNRGIVSRFFKPGTFNPDDLLEQLEDVAGDQALDIRGFHIYTFNQVRQTEQWRRARSFSTA